MKKFAFILGIMAIAGLSSCVSKKKLDSMTTQRDLFFEEKEKAELALKKCTEDNAQLNSDLSKCQGELENARKDLKTQQELYMDTRNDYNNLKDAYDRMLSNNRSENQKLLQELNEKENKLRKLEDDLREREKRVKELEDILQAQKDAVANLRDKLLTALKGYADKGLSVYEKNGRVYVSMDEKLLFESGKTEVNKDGIAALNDLAVVLSQDKTLQITVEGHTDNVPLRGSGAIKDNWDLSVLRATAVTKILMQNTNIGTNQIMPAGRGEFMPIADNDSKEGRAKNRRTDIIISPDLNEIYKLIQGINEK